MTAKRLTATVICASAPSASRAGRAALVLLGALGATMALGADSKAGAGSGETVVTSHPRSGGGYVLEVNASPGQFNRIEFIRCLRGPNDPAGCLIRERAGATEDSPRCTQESPTEVRCKLQGLRRINVATGDRFDALSLRGTDPSRVTCQIKLGRGSDAAHVSGRCVVHGNRGTDQLVGGTGNQRLFGGRHADTIWGGPGNNDYCNGQRGNDGYGDGCETKISP
jgi:hypothetical protein